MVYYYFQESVGKTAPDHDIAGESSQATPTKATGGLKDAALKERTDILPQDKGEVRSSGQEAACPTPAGKEVAEEKETAGTPGCEDGKAS